MYYSTSDLFAWFGLTYSSSYTDVKPVGIIMEPVAETDMLEYLKRIPSPSCDYKGLMRFIGCLCSTVQYLHSKNVRHKDIKPGNILILRDQVLITDFGVARDWTELEDDMTLGDPGAFTSAYAAPEVHERRPRNSKSDISSLGCVFLDMLVWFSRLSPRAR